MIWQSEMASVNATETFTRPAHYSATNTRTMFIMAAALGLKDRYTQAHAQRVALYARRLALRLGLSDMEAELVAIGGLLHDVGKLALSDQIFSDQKTDLTKELLWEVKSHPIMGAAMLKRLNCPATICDVALCHHERIDGNGYPFGLQGNAIPLSARIVSVADCFDAITTDRPYQKRQSCNEAILALSEMAGTHLASDLVALFIDDILRNGMIQEQADYQVAREGHLPN
jgi:putative nucleotidyltransferase with HDIG domain